MSVRYYALLGIAAFLLTALLQMPAARLVARFSSPGMPVLYGLEGTLLQGAASGGVVVNGRPLLQKLDWQLSPWRLLLLRAVFDVSATGDQLSGQARLSLQPGGRMVVKNLNATLDVRSLAAAAGQSYVPLDGQAQIQMQRLELKAETAPVAEGRIELRGLRWTLAQSPLALGDFEAVLAPEGETLNITLASLAGLLDLKGTVSVKPDRTYQLDLQLRPKAQADPALAALIRSLGPADSQAWHRLRRSGQL